MRPEVCAISRVGDQALDVHLAADHALEVALDALPALVFQRDSARPVRDPEHVHHDSVAAGRDPGREDVEVVGGQHAGDLREQAGLIARHDHELGEFALAKVAMAADGQPVVQRAHQIEVHRDVVFGRDQKVAVGHQLQELFELGLRRARARELRGDRGLDQRQPARGIDRLAVALLQDLERSHVEIAEQHVAPVVVDVGRDGAHVGEGQEQQRLEPIDRADGAHEAGHRAVVVDIALLGHLRHQQMIAHQKDDQVALFAVQREPAADLGGELRAEFVMVVAVALADIVKQQRQEDQAGSNRARGRLR